MQPHRPELRSPTDLLGMINVSGIMDGARVDGSKAFDSLALQEVPGLANIKMENRVNMARNQLPRIISEAKTVDIIDQRGGEDGPKQFIVIHGQVDGHNARLTIPASEIDKAQLDKLIQEANHDKFRLTSHPRGWNDLSMEAINMPLTEELGIDQNMVEKNFRLAIDQDDTHTEEIYATHFDSLDGNGTIGWKGSVERGENLTESVDITSRVKTEIWPDSKGGTEKRSRSYTSLRLSRENTTYQSSQDPNPGAKTTEEETLVVDIDQSPFKPKIAKPMVVRWGKSTYDTNPPGRYEASRYEALMNRSHYSAVYTADTGWHNIQGDGGPIPPSTMVSFAFKEAFNKARIEEGSHKIPDIARALSTTTSMIPETQDELNSREAIASAREARILTAARKLETRSPSETSRTIAEHFKVPPEQVQQFQNLIQSLGLRYANEFQLGPTIMSESITHVDGSNMLLAHIPELTTQLIEWRATVLPALQQITRRDDISVTTKLGLNKGFTDIERKLTQDMLASIPTSSYWKSVSRDQIAILSDAIAQGDFRAYVENVILIYRSNLEIAGLNFPQNSETFHRLSNETGLDAWYQQQFGEDISSMNARYTRDHQGMYEPATFNPTYTRPVSQPAA